MPEFVVSETDAGLRADVFVARAMAVSRSQAAKMIEGGHVHVRGCRVKPGRLVDAGDVVSIEPPPRPTSALEPEPMALNVVYQDPFLVVLNKPRGLVVHPGAGHSRGTLVHGLLAHGIHLSLAGSPERPGIVHRLDRDTSGLMVVAVDERAHRALQAQIQQRSVRREYAAIVWGDPPFSEATVDAAIGRHPADRKRMAVLPTGSSGAREARTELAVVERFGPMALMHARLHTGRTHQIRVHCAYAGHPIVGDPVYGKGGSLPAVLQTPRAARVRNALGQLTGQALHAQRLSFVHPATGERMQFEAAHPDDMERILTALREIVGRRT